MKLQLLTDNGGIIKEFPHITSKQDRMQDVQATIEDMETRIETQNTLEWDWLAFNPDVFGTDERHRRYKGVPENCVIVKLYDDDDIWYLTVWARNDEAAEEAHDYCKEAYGTTRSELAEFKPFIG